MKNQLFPTSGTVMVRTRPTLAKLIHVQKVSRAACPLLGTIFPSNLLNFVQNLTTMSVIKPQKKNPFENSKFFYFFKKISLRDCFSSISNVEILPCEEGENLSSNLLWFLLDSFANNERLSHYLQTIPTTLNSSFRN